MQPSALAAPAPLPPKTEAGSQPTFGGLTWHAVWLHWDPLDFEGERNMWQMVDAEWNDDWHNALHVALTGETQGYYSRFARDPFGDLALALTRGQVDEGAPHPEEVRGAPAGHLPWTALNSKCGGQFRDINMFKPTLKYRTLLAVETYDRK